MWCVRIMDRRRSTIEFKTDTASAMKKLSNAVSRLGADDLDYGTSHTRDYATAYVKFSYKGNVYRFEYSKSRAAYFGINLPQQKDVMIVLINGIVDLARLAERGVFDFGQLIQGFRSLEYIEVPKWAVFMGFNTRPLNFGQVREKFNSLVKGAMNPERNPDDYRQLQEYMEIAKQYFGVT